ncbi:transposase [Ferruginibacter paludis]|uniref:transposase n=1 Tax=Ferruginibacter paludis TaxID=1310417 RepID=UPI0025B32C64|nr:transposase [Ferruginibacter paludis]MDN3653998.1 transposase [Ferruginibacter paludis]
MSYKQGIAREQMSMFSLDCVITNNNAVRLIDLFVEQLDLAVLGFTKTTVKKEGCPPYNAKDMLKLYYYGYLNRIRSSRKLEAECTRT